MEALLDGGGPGPAAVDGAGRPPIPSGRSAAPPPNLSDRATDRPGGRTRADLGDALRAVAPPARLAAAAAALTPAFPELAAVLRQAAFARRRSPGAPAPTARAAARPVGEAPTNGAPVG